MGAGGSIPRTEYQRERMKDLSGSDLIDLSNEEVRDELQRIRNLLHKYADEKTVDNTNTQLTDIIGTVGEQRSLCTSHILHFRKMLRQPSLIHSRKIKDKRRRLSLQGQQLAKMALNGISATPDSDTDSDDGLEDMPRK